MRSLVHSLLVTALMIWSAVADLRYVAILEQDGEVVDASHIEFVKTPPLRHGKHGRHSSSRRDASAKDNISYSDNWCGVSHRSTPSDPVSNIFGYFTVPDLTLRPGIPAPQFAAAWIGVDGAKCNSTMLQAGVTTVVSKTKEPNVRKEVMLMVSGSRSTPTVDRARQLGGSGFRKHRIPSRVSLSSLGIGCRLILLSKMRGRRGCKWPLILMTAVG